jgi:regulatory protein
LKEKHVKNLASLNKSVGYGLFTSGQSHGAEKARAYAFLLLKFRLRSENELKERLKQKGFTPEIAEDTVSFLKDREFLDDRVFAKGWVASRLKRPLGLRRIQQELAQKGLAKEIIQSALAQAKEGYAESQIVSQLAKQRFSKLKNIEPLKARIRVYGYLIRRGFSSEVVGEVMRATGKEMESGDDSLF